MPSPYRLRWALPRALKTERAWQIASIVSLLLAGLFIGRYLMSPLGAAIFAALPMYRTMAHLLILVDQAGFASALMLALMARRYPYRTAALSFVLSGVSEKVPIFAALWSWHPAPLAGLPMVALAWWATPKGAIPEACRSWLGSPLRSARERHSGPIAHGVELVLPWGAALLACLSAPTWQLGLTLLVAYGQLLIACDRVRLYQWAAPVVLRHALTVIPPRWGIAAVLATWCNPWGGIRL